MSLGRRYCGLFAAATAAIGSATWFVSNYIKSTIKTGIEEGIQATLDTEMALSNQTTSVLTPFSPVALPFTLQRISFTLHETLTQKTIDSINNLPDDIGNDGRYAVLAMGAVVLSLTAGLIYTCSRVSALEARITALEKKANDDKTDFLLDEMRVSPSAMRPR